MVTKFRKFESRTKGHVKGKEIKCKTEMWKRNSSLITIQLKKPRKNVLIINLLLLWAIFLCFFIGLSICLLFYKSDLTFSTQRRKWRYSKQNWKNVKINKSHAWVNRLSRVNTSRFLKGRIFMKYLFQDSFIV